MRVPSVYEIWDILIFASVHPSRSFARRRTGFGFVWRLPRRSLAATTALWARLDDLLAWRLARRSPTALWATIRRAWSFTLWRAIELNTLWANLLDLLLEYLPQFVLFEFSEQGQNDINSWWDLPNIRSIGLHCGNKFARPWINLEWIYTLGDGCRLWQLSC